MDFYLKTSKLCDQEAVDKYLAIYGFHLNSEIKIESCLHGVDVSSAPPKGEGVYMHPQVLALGLRLSMTKFVHSVLTFYKVTPSQLSAIAWRTILGFEALCDLYALEACQLEVFSVAYSLRKTIQSARYFFPQSRVEKIIVNMVNSDMVYVILWFE